MKKILLVCFFIFFLGSSAYSATITSTIAGGEWSSGTTWIGGTVPTSGDVVIIQSTATVTITNTSVGLNSSRQNLTITVNGTLSLVYTGGQVSPLPAGSGNGAAGLWLTTTSSISISSGGQLNSSSNNTLFGTPVDYNFISNGTNWWEIDYLGGFDGTINGPAIIDNNGVQPIDLLSFTAKLSGEVVEIAWVTASERENDYFTLERSTDGTNWEIIAEEPGAGNSDVQLHYQYVDRNPVPGLSYYRLKQTDYDGQFEYFSPAVVLYEPNNLFKVYPNPTADLIQITTSSELSNAHVLVKNLNGKVLNLPVSTSLHRASVDLSGLPAGVYLLDIRFPESVLTKRIVKK